eukprot:359972-Chlamydomonas_euryale.AAC.8
MACGRGGVSGRGGVDRKRYFLSGTAQQTRSSGGVGDAQGGDQVTADVVSWYSSGSAPNGPDQKQGQRSWAVHRTPLGIGRMGRRGWNGSEQRQGGGLHVVGSKG